MVTKMTNQEAFDTVATHLFAQGEQSISRSPDGIFTCLYRSPDGKRCAIGAILPDALYRSTMEKSNVLELLDFVDVAAFFDGVNERLLMSLQSCHDWAVNWRTTKHMTAKLSRIAAEHGLSDDVLKTLRFADGR